MIRRRLRSWFENRLPRSDSWTLNQRNLYILPTAAGWGCGLTLVVMLLAAINYQLNLGFALTFLLGGAALVSLHQTHGNLRRLTLRLRPPAPVFAGEAATLELVLDNPGGTRHGVALGLLDAPPDSLAFCDVPAQGSATVQLRVPAPQRGRQRLPTLRVQTHFPLGLFRAWTVWRPAAELLVYPAPEPAPPPLPAPPGGGEADRTPRPGQGGEFDGVRSYRRGDAMRQVVWKKLARAGELVSRDLAGHSAHDLLLDAGAAALSDPEARLSRLCAWVLAADRQGLGYALQLSGAVLPAASGEAQRRAALQWLALWPDLPRGDAPAPSGDAAA